MLFIESLLENLTAGQLAFISVTYLVIGGLGVSAGFVWGGQWLRGRREDMAVLVAIERDPTQKHFGTYMELGTGFPFTESGTLYITPTSLVTTRFKAHHQGAKRRSTLNAFE